MICCKTSRSGSTSVGDPEPVLLAAAVLNAADEPAEVKLPKDALLSAATGALLELPIVPEPAPAPAPAGTALAAILLGMARAPVRPGPAEICAARHSRNLMCGGIMHFSSSRK